MGIRFQILKPFSKRKVNRKTLRLSRMENLKIAGTPEESRIFAMASKAFLSLE